MTPVNILYKILRARSDFADWQ